jgi:tetratricopeptide (TPR) repeat protein
LAGALWAFWLIRGYLSEGSSRLERALGADTDPTAARARALNGAAALTMSGGDISMARGWAEEGRALGRQLGDAFGAAFSTFLLGHIAKELSDWAKAQKLFDESLSGFRELGDDHYILMATDLLALAFYKLGDRERAVALCEANLRQARATGDLRMEATELGALALYALEDGRVQEALPLLVQSTHMWRELGTGEFSEVGQNICCFARVAATVGRSEVAVELLAAAASLSEEIGAAESPYVTDLNDKTLATVRQHLDEAAFAREWQRGGELTLDQAIDLALTVPP